MNRCSPMGLVSQQWDTDDWACVLYDHHIHNDIASRSASSWQCACPFYRSRAGYVTKASHHPGMSTALQPRFGFLRLDFYKSWNSNWNGREWRMRWSHSTQAQSTASHCRLTSPTGCPVRSPLAGYQVTSRPRNRVSRHSKWTDTFRTALIQLHPHIPSAMNASDWPVLWAGCFTTGETLLGMSATLKWRIETNAGEHPLRPRVWCDWTPRTSCTHTHPAPVCGLPMANEDIWV